MKNLLITGGSGYVGTRLINYLLQKNNKIKIINYDLSIFGMNIFQIIIFCM